MKEGKIKDDFLILKYILSSLLFLFSFTSFAYSRYVFSFLFLIFALFFLPVVERFLEKKYKIFKVNKLGFWIKCVLILFLYILLIYTAPRCGDGRCNGNEDSISCVQDCGTLCGDGVCNGDETPCNCVSDCGECSSQEVCKKAFCNQEEQCIISIKEPCCGNGKIELGETCANCNQDVVCDSNQTCCNEQCLEIKWVCSDWSPCTNTGTQTRNCVETTGCLTNQYKPLEIQDRSYIPSIGEKLVVGNFEYHFKGLTEKKSVGDKSVYFTNEANGVYYILDFKITNVGKKADIIPLDQILIVDYDENEYSYDSSALFYLSNAISFYEQLNPGVSISGKIAYDVPKGLKGKLKIGDGSLLSPSYKEFNLKK